MEKISPAQAVTRGVISVYRIVVPVMVGVPMLTFATALLLGVDGDTVIAAIGWSALPKLILAWITWSYLVPRWRIWAYEGVDDLTELKMEAVRAGLIWPEGNLFERTEFRTPEQRERIQALEKAFVASKITGE